MGLDLSAWNNWLNEYGPCYRQVVGHAGDTASLWLEYPPLWLPNFVRTDSKWRRESYKKHPSISDKDDDRSTWDQVVQTLSGKEDGKVKKVNNIRYALATCSKRFSLRESLAATQQLPERFFLNLNQWLNQETTRPYCDRPPSRVTFNSLDITRWITYILLSASWDALELGFWGFPTAIATAMNVSL